MTDDLAAAIARLRKEIGRIDRSEEGRGSYIDDRSYTIEGDVIAACDVCEQQAQEIVRLRAANDSWHLRVSQLNTDSAQACEERDRARALAASCQAALGRYGRHSVECELYDPYRVHGHDKGGFTTERRRTADDPPPICTCGLAVALAKEP